MNPIARLRTRFRETYIFGYMLFHETLAAGALVLILGALWPAVHAQDRAEVRELDRRVTSIEGMNLDHRLTSIEQLLIDLKQDQEQDRKHGPDWMQIGTAIAGGLLVLERASMKLARKVEEEEK